MIEYALYKNEGKEDRIRYTDLDKQLYNLKYKDKLYCINGCEAKIKFNQRTNGFKYFSAYPNHGKLHEKECPYYVEYEGEIGRLDTNAENLKAEPRAEHIVNSILNWEKEKEAEKTKAKPRMKVKNAGNKNVISLGEEGETSKKGLKEEYIKKRKTTDLNGNDIGKKRLVKGFIRNIQCIKSENSQMYAYINLDNKVSISLPQAFYGAENNNITKFKKFINLLKDNFDQRGFVDWEVIAYGEIRGRGNEQEGFTVKVLDYRFLHINKQGYEEIIRRGQIMNP